MGIRVKRIERTSHQRLTVEFVILGFVYIIDEVVENIMRCALGEADLEYLTAEMPTDEQVEQSLRDGTPLHYPSNDESQCFGVCASEFKDCMRTGYIRTDSFGRVAWFNRE